MDRPERIFGMFFSAYFDESGGLDHDYCRLRLAGVGCVGQRFEKEWKLLLSIHDVPYLHMKELAHFNGTYDKWLGKITTSLRIEFLKEAAHFLEGRQSGYYCNAKSGAFATKLCRRGCEARCPDD
jgi:hypothetical protein